MSRTRKRGGQSNVCTESELTTLQLTNRLKRRARIAAKKEAQKKYVADNLKSVLSAEKLEAKKAWDRVLEYEEDVGGYTCFARQCADFAAEIARCEVSGEVADRDAWVLQEEEAQAVQGAKRSRMLAQKARKFAFECDDDAEITARMVKRAVTSHALAKEAASRLKDEAAGAEAAVVETVKEVQLGRGAAARVARGASSCDEDDDQEEPKAKRARR